MASDPDALAEELLGLTAALTVELHPGIAHTRRRGPREEVVGLPVAGVFEQPPAGRSKHRSGRPSPEVLALAVHAAEQVRASLRYGADEDSPALVPLSLAAFYVVEARRSGALGLGEAAAQRPEAAALDEQAARRDPTLPPGARLLRVWARMDPSGDVCVELRFARAAL